MKRACIRTCSILKYLHSEQNRVWSEITNTFNTLNYPRALCKATSWALVLLHWGSQCASCSMSCTGSAFRTCSFYWDCWPGHQLGLPLFWKEHREMIYLQLELQFNTSNRGTPLTVPQPPLPQHSTGGSIIWSSYVVKFTHKLLQEMQELYNLSCADIPPPISVRCWKWLLNGRSKINLLEKRVICLRRSM